MPVSFFKESEERLKWNKVIYIIRCWYINITYILIYNNTVCVYIYIYMLINEKVKGSFPILHQCLGEGASEKFFSLNECIFINYYIWYGK
jgi:hypothetical protein